MKKIIAVLLILSVIVNIFLFLKLEEKKEDYKRLNEMYYEETISK